ncbi:tripartite tricarboxylate transporter substrate binding protein [Pseudorhodoferax sp.]|uniref:tripartite tricarboxylate transporter substrate binding protein n=1 Tax=Pseudorhodoferax sp. TaxID=1993553 RepID=UPI0039E3E844
MTRPFQRRQLLHAAAALPLAALAPARAQQPYPARPLHIVVPSSTGTSTDTTARFFGEALTRRLGVPVVVENRGGAGGLIAYNAVAKSPPDGYTILLSGLPLYLLPLFSEAPDPFDPVKDFTPIARAVRAPLAFVVPVDSPYRTLGELLQALKSRADDLTYSSQGIGSSAHLCGVLLNNVNQSSARHIPFKETSAAVTDVAAGRIAFSCQGSSSVLPLVQGGRLRALAVTSPTRWSSLPDVPTAAEAGLPGFEMWPGLDFVGPAGLPAPVVQALSDAVMQIGQTAEYRTLCDKVAMLPEVMDHRQLKAAVPQEAAQWKRIALLARGTA